MLSPYRDEREAARAKPKATAALIPRHTPRPQGLLWRLFLASMPHSIIAVLLAPYWAIWGWAWMVRTTLRFFGR